MRTAQLNIAENRCCVRREAIPLRPVLAHEAIHYIEIPDYIAFNKKFDDFCQQVEQEYLNANDISKPRYLEMLIGKFSAPTFAF